MKYRTKARKKRSTQRGTSFREGSPRVEDCRGRVAAEGSFGAGMENKK